MTNSISIITNADKTLHFYTRRNVSRYKKVMADYLLLMQNALLDGYEWKIPGNFGSFRVEKKIQARVPLKRIPKNGKLEKVSHLNRIGYSYQLVFVSGVGRDVKDYKFETAASFRKLLTSILMNTQKDYPFYDKH